MDINEFCYLLKEQALDSDNYKQWRIIHGRAFGEIFLNAFEENDEAQIHLTSALIKISQRRFNEAIPQLELLNNFCFNDFDTAALSYFTGLNYEFIGNEEKMKQHYNRMLDCNLEFTFNVAFQPYYRTAKLAQKQSECTKALFYYNQAASFYGSDTVNFKAKKVLSQVYYDIATVYTYMHEFDKANDALDLSYKYDSQPNEQRDYVAVLLYTFCKKDEESESLISNMSPLLRNRCRNMVLSIKKEEDPHYFVIEQDKAYLEKFWKMLSKKKKNIQKLINSNEYQKAEDIVSEILTATFQFMNRKLECKIKKDCCKTYIMIKNYYVKTYCNELAQLFNLKDNSFTDWEFVSVNEFECFNPKLQ
ncbi:MAG: hypothetical protein IJN78_05950 [Clostridia bacterium]|nr:hypothetical protein [Clostridia bacterium]